MDQLKEEISLKYESPKSNLGIVSVIIGCITLVLVAMFVFINSFLILPAIWLGLISFGSGILQLIRGKHKAMAIGGIVLSLSAFILTCFVFISGSESESVIKNPLSQDLNNAVNELENSLEESDVHYDSLIYGTWIMETASYELNTDGTWGWYKDNTVRDNNYYSGSDMIVVSGQSALDQLGIDEEERKRLSIDKHRFFYLQLPVKTFISGGEDRSFEFDDQDAKYQIAIYFPEWSENNEAMLINVDTMEQFVITRQVEDEIE